jgi:two-component system, cell cycle sensor histidine kinase and response regulator CckA
VGKGTQFQIFLPAITQSVLPTENKHRYPIGQGEVILVVDDEAQIRETLRITLEYYNYQVITAKNGIEAIAIYTDRQRSIDCILMDIKMPSMDGMSAIPIITQLNPQVKIIVFSGTATGESLASLSNIQAFLPKPYTAEALLETLHRILNVN